MGTPAILAVDDDPLVLASVQRDLRSRYVTDYQILGADSGASALTVLASLAARGDPVALLVADQRMPEMTGVEFLEAARRLDESTQRVLLTAYADTEAAIAAINRAGARYYILKPWDPPEEKLFPIIDDLLEEWRAGYRPTFSGIRVLGDRWSPSTHRIKDLLARNQIPYQSVDAGGPEGQMLLGAVGVAATDLPVVLFEDGTRLIQPDLQTLAEAVQLSTHSALDTYDLVIVGAGPSGLAAAVYAASEGLSVLAVEREAPGGQAGQSARIENYLGFPAGVSGADLTRRAVTQTRRFEAELVVPVEAAGLSRSDPFRVVRFADGREVNSKAVLVATGVSYRMLPARGAEALAGRGLYYGASPLEASEAKGQDVAIVGSGNSAGQAALFLAGNSRSVIMLVRGDSLAAAMSSYLVERIEATDNIDVRYRTDVSAIEGSDRVEALIVSESDVEERLAVASVFVFIGQAPRTEWLGDLVQRDPQGFVLTGSDCTLGPDWSLARPPFPLETSLPGVFAAGDVRSGSIKRVASAAGEGAMAVRFIHQHLESL